MGEGYLLACVALGRAANVAQLFEWTLTLCFYFYRTSSDKAFLEETQGCIPKKFFEETSAKQIRQLIAAGAIGPEFLARWRTYKDARNLLIHRWEFERGWPADDAPPEAFKPLIEHASRVRQEATSLTNALIDYVLEHQKNPDAWAHIFKKVC